MANVLNIKTFSEVIVSEFFKYDNIVYQKITERLARTCGESIDTESVIFFYRHVQVKIIEG